MIPTVRFAKRLDSSTSRPTITRVAGGVVAVLIAGIILQLTGRDALSLAGDAWNASFGSKDDFVEMGGLATPILMAAIAVTFAFRARLWNLGVDGQLLMGAWAAAGVGLHIDGPDWLMLILMALAAMVAGALWILVPALLRVYLGMSEVITTLLLNFIAELWVTWYATNIWRDPDSGVLNSTKRIKADLPLVFGSQTLHAGFVVPLVLIVVFGLLFRLTRWGYEVDMTGGNLRAARVAGLPVERRLFGTLLASGAIAGLGGMLSLVGNAHRLSPTIANGAGFTGFIIAALAAGSAVGLLLVGVFLAALARAGISLQTEGLSTDVVLAINGVILMVVGLADVWVTQRLVVTWGRGGRRRAAVAGSGARAGLTPSPVGGDPSGSGDAEGTGSEVGTVAGDAPGVAGGGSPVGPLLAKEPAGASAPRREDDAP